MHLSRDTHNLLNESIRSLSLEEDYDILTEEQFNEAYEDYINFLIENYTDEELENLTEEELMEGFLSRVAGAAGTAVHRTGQAIKGVGKTLGDMRTQYKRGLAGELTWTGAERYPSKEEPKKDETETETETKTEKDKKTKKNPKISPEQIEKLKNTKEAIKERRKRQVNKATTKEDDLAMSLRQRLQSKGLITDKGEKTEAGKAAASNVKDKSIKAAETVKNTMLKSKRGAAYSKCIEKGGDEKKCMRYASSIMASKEYYSDLRKRLIENYKK